MAATASQKRSTPTTTSSRGISSAPTPAARNVISGNSHDGVLISGVGTTNNLVASNFIGLDVTGTAAVPNHNQGLEIVGGATANIVGGVTGQGNVISGNTNQGIVLTD